jgi:propanol-preferring alcohol dehydrogenase
MTDIPALQYGTDLFEERVLTSVTANTRQDGHELLRIAAEARIRPETTEFPLERANEALLALKQGAFSGSGILRVSS